MPAKDPFIYVRHMQEACGRIRAYVSQAGPNWERNSLVLDAVCRNITVIGEAARRIDTGFQQEHPKIPWAALIGARNIVMHAYESVRPDLVRDMAEIDVPKLLAECGRLLAEQ